MATYINNLRLKEITTGDEDGTWGTSTNTNLELITDGFSFGTKEIAADANETFTMPDATADATRSLYLKFTSAVSLTATREITLGPNTVSKTWIIENATSGGQIITIKQGSGATVDVANGYKVMVVTDGAGAAAAVLNANPTAATNGTVTSVAGTGTVQGLTLSGTVTTAGSLTLGGSLSDVDLTSQITGTLPIANGGTGQVTANAAFNALAPSQASANGKYLKSDGTNSSWDQIDISTGDITGTLPVANGGTGVTSSTGSGNNVLSTSPTLATPSISTPTFTTYGNIKALFETATITASAPSATTNFDVTTQAVQFYTSNASTNFTLNIRGDGSTTLNSILSTGQSVTLALLVTNGATPYYPNVIQIDGSAVTPKWQTGNAPTGGNASSIDVYTFAVVKTASATFTVLASQTKFA